MKRVCIYDLLGVMIISLLLAITIIRIEAFPFYVDIYYHIAIMRSFDLAGGITIHDFIHFAPFGRPHVYPPLFHIMLYVPYKLGMSPGDIARVASALIYPSIIFSLWYTTRKIFSQRIGLLTLLVITPSFQFYFMSSVYCTSMISTCLFLWCSLFLYEKRTFPSIILLSMSLYTHPSCPHLLSISLMVWAIADKERRDIILKTLGMSYALFLPWGLNILANLNRLSVMGTHDIVPDLVILETLFGIIGIFISMKEILVRKKFEYLLPISMFSLFFPIHYFYGSRAFVHYFIPLSILCAVALNTGIQKAKNLTARKHRISIHILIIISIMTMTTCQMVFQPYEDNKFIFSSDTTSKMLFTKSLNSSHIYDYDRTLIDAILDYTAADDIIFIDNGVVGSYISALTGRATTNGIFMEVAPDDPYELRGPFKAFVYDNLEDPRIKEDSNVIATKKYVLEILDEKYVKTRSTASQQYLPTSLALGVLVISIVLLLYDDRRYKK